MPDTGDFDRDKTRSWSDAFVALPQESPDSDGWQRAQARLPSPATRPRTRWPLWLAAALALVAVIPLRVLWQAEPDLPNTPIHHSGESRSPALAVGHKMLDPGLRRDDSEAISPLDAQPVSMPVARLDTPRSATRIPPPSQRPIRTTQPTDANRIAETDTSTAAASPGLEPLYAKSAQLESLLAMARDDRVASGTSAALSEELDRQVAVIDTALIQPGLSDTQRANLWGQRVDTLQQLVGIETTNRLYASRGQTYDVALVSID